MSCTLPYWQSSSVPLLVDVIMLMDDECAVKRFDASEISHFVFPTLVKVWCGLKNKCGINIAMQHGKGTLKRFWCSFAIVLSTLTRTEGWLPFL